jgi:flagellar hook protein FlgE
MSIVGAFIAGVTGIDAQSQKIGAISDNISNANTVGYKPTEVRFKTLVTRTDAPTSTAFNANGGSSGSVTGPIPFNFAPGGVIPVPVARMDLQGLMTASSSNTDIAISGNGFFPVVGGGQVNTTIGAIAQGASVLVTRAGSFHVDQNGFLVNSAGFVALGTPAGGGLPRALTGLVPVKFAPGPTVTIGGVATTQVTIDGNLPATDAIGAQENMTTGVFDAAGNAYTAQIQFTKTALNTWSAAIASVTQAGTTTPPITATVSGSPMTLSFGTNGQLTGGGVGSLGTVTLSNGQSLSPTFNFMGPGSISALTQFDSAEAQSGVQQDGKASGSRTGFQIDNTGVVSETFSNGVVRPGFQIPVVTFPNPEGLQAESGNVWLPTGAAGTLASGNAAINAASTGSAGQIVPATLEQSAVDLAEEFSQMIVSQQAFQANTKTITTADQMYQLVTQLR